MKKNILIFPLSLSIIFIQMYTFGGKTLLENKAENNPYLLSDGNAFKVISGSEELGTATFQLHIQDNLSFNFYNWALDYEINNETVNVDGTNYPVTFLPYQSDEENGDFRFQNNINYSGQNQYLSLENFYLAIDAAINPIQSSINLSSDLNVTTNTKATKPVEYANYPEIVSYNSPSGDGFTLSVYDNSLTFQLTVRQGKLPGEGLSVILKDELDPNPRTNTKIYEAYYLTPPLTQQTENNREIYSSFEIDNLPPSTYTFIGIANSGYTKVNVDATSPAPFNPDSNIFFTSELNYEPSELTFTIGTQQTDNPYITSFQIIDTSITISSIQFSIQITDNSTNNFYNNLIAQNKQMDVTLINITNGNQTINLKANWIDSVQPTDGVYIFEVNGLNSNTDYGIYSLNNTGLAVEDSTNKIDNEITITDDLDAADNTFTTTSDDNPYIVTDSFEIMNITSSSVQFQITVVNNSQNSFVPENDLDVTLKDNEGVVHQTTAHYTTTSSNTYTYEITELESGISLIPGENYEIYSLNNTGLAINNFTSLIDDQILITDDLGEDGHFTTITDLPYVESGSFAIIETTKVSVEFQIKVNNNSNNDFVPENDLNVTLKDNQGVSHQTTAHYVRTDTVDPNIYVYEITELESGVILTPGENYEIYSLNNTGLSIDSSAGIIDDEIIISTDLLGDGAFSTIGNPYVENGSFAILNTTKTSVEFQITVSNNSLNEFIPESNLNVTLKDEEGINHETTAHYVKADEIDPNTYIYEITEESSGILLKQGTDYEIYSLNNTGLAIGEDSSVIDDEILITDDLGGDGSFTTIGNPFIEYGSFAISNTTKTSVEFQITVNNNSLNEFIPGNLAVKIKTDDQVIHQTTATYIGPDGTNPNTYYYQITELEVGVPLEIGTNYEIISLLNTGLAVSDDSNVIDDEIMITDDLGGNGDFTTIANPYLELQSFSITNVNESSVEFKLKVEDNELDEFDPTIPINVTLKDSSGISHSSTANYLRTDTTDPNIFYYEITELETGVSFVAGESYDIYSLNNTGLATGNGSTAIDDEITITDDLGGDGSFAFASIPYVYDQGFLILDSTSNSVKFQLKVENTDNQFDSENLNVTIKNNDSGAIQSQDADLITEESQDNIYTYELTNLGTESNYEFVSLNDVYLGIGGEDLTIYEDINLISDLGMAEEDLKFDTIVVPYLENENSFQIIDESIGTNSVKFSLSVYGWETTYKQEIDVKMLNYSTGEEEVHSAKFVEKSDESYTYEITDLISITAYEFVSLLDINLAIGNENAQVQSEINLENDLGISQEELHFSTKETFLDKFSALFLFLLIFDLTLIIFDIWIAKAIKNKGKENSQNWWKTMFKRYKDK